MRRVLAATLWLVIAVSAAAHGSSRSLLFHFSNDDEGSDDPGADAADSTQSTDLAETSYGHGRAHRMRRTVATGPNGEAININLNVDRDEEGVSAQRGGEANFHASRYRDHQENELKHLEAEVSELRSEISSDSRPEEVRTAPESEVMELRQELSDAKRQLRASKFATTPRLHSDSKSLKPDLASIERKIRDDVAEAAQLMHANLPSKEVPTAESSTPSSELVLPSQQLSTTVHSVHDKPQDDANVVAVPVSEPPPVPVADSTPTMRKAKQSSFDAGLEKSIEQEAGAFNQNTGPCLPPLLC